MEPTSPNPSIFPFLRLPPEIRNQIYALLAPDLGCITPWIARIIKAKPLRYSFRKDDEKCGPSILRLNRQIYTEALPIWYGTTWYSLEVTKSGFKFLLADTGPYCTNIPLTIQAVKFLDVAINLLPLKELESCKSRKLLKPVISLAKFLARGDCAVRKLHLRLQASEEVMAMAKSGKGAVRKALTLNLKPLRRLRGVAEVEAGVEEFHDGGRNKKVEDLSKKVKMQYMAASRIFLDIFELEMTVPEDEERGVVMSKG